MRALRQASCLQRGSPAIRPPGRASSRPHIVPLRCWHPSVSVVAVLAGHLGENLILHFRDNESISFFSAFASLFVHPAPSTGSMCHYGPLPWAGRLIIKKKIEKKKMPWATRSVWPLLCNLETGVPEVFRFNTAGTYLRL